MSQPDTSSPSMATLLDPTAASPMAARAFARDTLESWQLLSIYDDVALIVGELITNSVLHGRGQITLSLSLLGSVVRIAVFDDSETLPQLRPPSAVRTNGRGLALISAVAQAWGADRHESSGKSVWAEVAIAAAV